jgi:hypothetical protein
MNDDVLGMWKEAGVVCLNCYFVILLEELKKTTELTCVIWSRWRFEHRTSKIEGSHEC